MTQKERSVLVIKSILLSPDVTQTTLKDVIEKVDACLELMRPEVLLSMDQRKIYDKLVEGLRKKGKII